MTNALKSQLDKQPRNIRICCYNYLSYVDSPTQFDARVLEIESNSRDRKYKESAHMACLINPVSQPSLDISPIWIPLISNEVSNSQRKSV
jgi:hypothetical protein